MSSFNDERSVAGGAINGSAEEFRGSERSLDKELVAISTSSKIGGGVSSTGKSS